jgi:transposase-like protein
LDSFHAYLITPPWWCGRPGRHGLSSSDFGPALEQFLGTGHGLWAATVTRLTKDWQGEATALGQRDLSGTDYVYVWVDGIHLKVRLAQDKVCLLVMIGVRADGAKELIALDDGHRGTRLAGRRDRDGVQTHRVGTAPLACRQFRPPRRAGQSRREVRGRRPRRTTR